MKALMNELRKLNKQELLSVLEYTVEHTEGGLYSASRALNRVLQEREEADKRTDELLGACYQSKVYEREQLLAPYGDIPATKLPLNVFCQVSKLDVDISYAKDKWNKHHRKLFGEDAVV